MSKIRVITIRLEISPINPLTNFRELLGLIKYFSLLLLLLLIFSKVSALEAQPISFGEIKTGSRLVYGLSGVYNGNKTYEFLSFETRDGRTCILARARESCGQGHLPRSLSVSRGNRVRYCEWRTRCRRRRAYWSPSRYGVKA